MEHYQGGCHCGAIRFSIETTLDNASQCNCSICTKKGVINHRVPPQRLRILQGEDRLGLYQFGTRTAKHWYCTGCGIHVFSNPRRAPDQYAVNLRCLDDFYRVLPGIAIKQFDGQHWEQAVRAESGAAR
ncbi:MAG: GFA family protein [Burkholderiales bacterium]|nr:GFA family protein [Burkholderiales bacterium]